MQRRPVRERASQQELVLVSRLGPEPGSLQERVLASQRVPGLEPGSLLVLVLGFQLGRQLVPASRQQEQLGQEWHRQSNRHLKWHE